MCVLQNNVVVDRGRAEPLHADAHRHALLVIAQPVTARRRLTHAARCKPLSAAQCPCRPLVLCVAAVQYNVVVDRGRAKPLHAAAHRHALLVIAQPVTARRRLTHAARCKPLSAAQCPCRPLVLCVAAVQYNVVVDRGRAKPLHAAAHRHALLVIAQPVTARRRLTHAARCKPLSAAQCPCRPLVLCVAAVQYNVVVDRGRAKPLHAAAHRHALLVIAQPVTARRRLTHAARCKPLSAVQCPCRPLVLCVAAVQYNVVVDRGRAEPLHADAHRHVQGRPAASKRPKALVGPITSSAWRCASACSGSARPRSTTTLFCTAATNNTNGRQGHCAALSGLHLTACVSRRRATVSSERQRRAEPYNALEHGTKRGPGLARPNTWPSKKAKEAQGSLDTAQNPMAVRQAPGAEDVAWCPYDVNPRCLQELLKDQVQRFGLVGCAVGTTATVRVVLMLPPKLRSEEYGSLEARYTAKLRQGEKGSWGLTDASGSRMTIRTWVKNKGLLLTGKYKAHRGPVLTGPHRLEIQPSAFALRQQHPSLQSLPMLLLQAWIAARTGQGLPSLLLGQPLLRHQLGCNRRRRGGQQPHLLILALLAVDQHQLSGNRIWSGGQQPHLLRLALLQGLGGHHRHLQERRHAALPRAQLCRSWGQVSPARLNACMMQPLLASLHEGGATAGGDLGAAEEGGPGPSHAAAGMEGVAYEGDPVVPPPAAAPGHAGLPGSNGQGVIDIIDLTQEEPGSFTFRYLHEPHLHAAAAAAVGVGYGW
ncbi:hypothetical protein V8C86DRAFT_2436968 [Haematococcus lacustris]